MRDVEKLNKALNNVYVGDYRLSVNNTCQRVQASGSNQVGNNEITSIGVDHCVPTEVTAMVLVGAMDSKNGDLEEKLSMTSTS